MQTHTHTRWKKKVSEIMKMVLFTKNINMNEIIFLDTIFSYESTSYYLYDINRKIRNSRGIK